jgi:hypothetical protein
MKPRLRVKWGVWSCASWTIAPDVPVMLFRIGYGYTPEEAYIDWRAQP